MAEPAVGGRSLKEAVVTALILLGLIIVCALLGTTAFFVLVVAVVLLALFELLDGLRQDGRLPIVPFGLACGLAMLLVAFFERPVYISVVLAGTMYGAFVLALRSGRGRSAGSDVAWTVLAVAWVGGGGAGAVSLLVLEPDGLLLLITYVLMTAADDIGAYFVGTNLGKHKMAPSISPAKSWEGWFGGLVSAIAAGIGFAAFIDPLEIIDGVALGVIVGFLAPVGDLVESMVKRELGIKDSGRLLPGHGGMLDRLDAILFCAPAAYLYVRLVAL